ncbi:MAG TPA: methyltransferase domain-containing protein [Candidatus Elarobacter sp.]|jgi:SAM-dependent methyltransferase|nr:methyltransferase domain-containing protein [Candidatus Elarobacter sp.]
MPGEINATYTRDDHAFRAIDPYAKAKYDLTLRWLDRRARPGDLLYNIGVGSGYFNHLAVARGMRVVGCEPDPTAFHIARAAAPAGTEVFNCGLLEFARGREPARFVVMHDVLEHIEDDLAAVAALRSIVAESGTAIVSVPALMSLFGRHDRELGHFRRYSARSLRNVLESRFTIEKLKWYGAASIPIVWYFSRLRRLPYPMAVAKTAAGAAYGTICHVETYLWEPVGTSLLAQIVPRA